MERIEVVGEATHSVILLILGFLEGRRLRGGLRSNSIIESMFSEILDDCFSSVYVVDILRFLGRATSGDLVGLAGSRGAVHGVPTIISGIVGELEPSLSATLCTCKLRLIGWCQGSDHVIESMIIRDLISRDVSDDA